MSRTYPDEAVAEAQRLIVANHGRVRSRVSSGRALITVDTTVDGTGLDAAGEPTKPTIVYFGRGRSLFDALVWLGAWEAH